MTQKTQTYDSPWKEILDAFFLSFMEFFIPQSLKDIDRNKKIKFLDKEFQKITKERELNKCRILRRNLAHIQGVKAFSYC